MAVKSKEEAQSGLENTHIEIDVFGSREIDLAPADKPKRRRQLDEYDYNDPFFEPFEGELEAVEIECKLENFFVYKGEMAEDPKKIARRFNKELKKRELQQSMLSGNRKPDTEDLTVFTFEKVLGKGGSNAKYKKEPSFLNRLFWLFLVHSEHLKQVSEKPTNEAGAPDAAAGVGQGKRLVSPPAEDALLLDLFLAMLDASPGDMYASMLVLSKHDSGKFPGPEPGSKLSEGEKNALLERKREEIEALYKGIVERLSDESRYDLNGKSYRDFKDDKAMLIFVKFYMLYILYYTVASDRGVNVSANLASEYLSASFPSVCTNNTKLKYYVRKVIDIMMAEEGYNPERVHEGILAREELPEGGKHSVSGKDREPGPSEASQQGPSLNGSSLASTTSPVTSLDLLSNSKSMNEKIFGSEPEKDGQ